MKMNFVYSLCSISEVRTNVHYESKKQKVTLR